MPLAAGHAEPISFGVPSVQVGLGQRGRHAGNLFVGERATAEQEFVGCFRLLPKQEQQTDSDGRDQQAGGETRGWRHRLEQVGDLSVGLVKEVHP